MMAWIKCTDRMPPDMDPVTPDYKARKLGKPTMDLRKRIYSRVKVNEETGCWEWQGCKRSGYGRTIIGSRTDGTRRTECTHRISYMLNYGEIPKGMEVCHKCDNPSCINPDHLFLGTYKDNAMDCLNKGRMFTQIGEEHASSKLTEEIVKNARIEYSKGNISSRELAKKYNVSRKTMWDALTGKTWKHVSCLPHKAKK